MEEGVGPTMSDAEVDEGREVSQRFADVEDELRQGESLGELMAQQWRGMAGMAGMFVATIALAMYIRPYYDVGELHAFGASGATQARYVLIELLAIFAFTALIIFPRTMGQGVHHQVRHVCGPHVGHDVHHDPARPHAGARL